MPRPFKRILSPFLWLLVMSSTMPVRISLAWRFGSSCASDRCSAMFRSDRTPLLFSAVALTGFLRAFPAEALVAALALLFDAAALRAGAFFVVVLVAVLAMGSLLLPIATQNVSPRWVYRSRVHQQKSA